MAIHRLLNNFTGGEWSPQLDARVDLQKYETSCRSLVNMRPLPWGGATMRAGTIYQATAKKDGSFLTRLIPFNFSTTVTFILEVGDFYMRFFYGTGPSANTQVMSGMSPYEISTPWGHLDIFQLQVKEINDVLYFTHPSYPVQKLSHVTDTNWTLAPVVWKYPALLDQNITATTLAVGATSGSTSLTSTTPIFNAGHVGSYWELQHLRDASSVSIAISGSSGTATSSTISVTGKWNVTTAQYWYGVLQVQRSVDNGSTWSVIRQFQSASDHNVQASGTEAEPVLGKPVTLLRLFYTATGDPFGTGVWAGGAPTQYVYAQATLESEDAYVEGIVKVTAYVSTTVVTVTVLQAPLNTAATTLWSEGAWSTYRGFPTAVGFFEQRMLFGGTTFKPNTLWGSVTADFENFKFSDADDGALAFQFADAQQNPIQWICALQRVHVGTTGEEFVVASGNLDEPITPSNITVRRQSTYGSNNVPAILIQNSILFVERLGRRVREVRELSPYVAPTEFTAPDLTLFSEHLFYGSIIQADFARLPDPLVYTIDGSGTMNVMTYNREQNITAWAKYTTFGQFSSVAVVSGDGADSVWVVATRVIGSSVVRYIERFFPEVNPRTSVYTDCSTVYSGSPVTTVSGLGYLEGMSVAVVADGSFLGNQVVTGGAVGIPDAASDVTVGLNYIGQLEPMKIDLMMANGTSQGRKRRLSEVCIRFKDTLGCFYNYSDDVSAGIDLPFRDSVDPMGSVPDLFTGDKVVPWPGGIDFDGRIHIKQTQPYPMTVLGIFGKFEVFGD